MRDIIEKVRAQIWVFTEVRTDFDPGGRLKQVAISDPANDLVANERWTAIWACEDYNGTEIKERHDIERTACALFKIGGVSLTVYGTVLPWVGSAWRGFPGKGGRAYEEALAEQNRDWAALRSDNAGGWLCVAGDFNQDLLNSGRYYGSKRQLDLLRGAFRERNLTCLTGGDADPVAKQSPGSANIDHICLSGPDKPNWRVANVQACSPQWQGTLISDHHCVAVDLQFD